MLFTNHTHLYLLNGILYRGIVCTSNKLQNIIFALGVKEVNQFFMCSHLYSQGWEKYRTTGPLAPENFLSPQKIV